MHYPGAKGRIGWLYLMQSSRSVKLGFSYHPETRLIQVRTTMRECNGHKRRVRLRAMVRGTYGDELALHAKFAEHRIDRHVAPALGNDWYPSKLADDLLREMIAVSTPARGTPAPIDASA